MVGFSLVTVRRYSPAWGIKEKGTVWFVFFHEETVRLVRGFLFDSETCNSVNVHSLSSSRESG